MALPVHLKMQLYHSLLTPTLRLARITSVLPQVGQQPALPGLQRR